MLLLGNGSVTLYFRYGGHMFTTAEYIKENGLDANIRNPRQTSLIAQHLRAKGYVNKLVRIDGVVTRVWGRPEEFTPQGSSNLAEQLAKL